MTERTEVTSLYKKEQLAGKPKYQIFNMFLAQGTIRVYLDPRAPEVDVPDFLKSEPVTMFEVGYDMEIPITDLVVSPQAFEATLSFNRTPVPVFVPWEVVLAITDVNSEGVAWGERVSQDTQGTEVEPPLSFNRTPITVKLRTNAERRKAFKVLAGGKE